MRLRTIKKLCGALRRYRSDRDLETVLRLDWDGEPVLRRGRGCDEPGVDRGPPPPPPEDIPPRRWGGPRW